MSMTHSTATTVEFAERLADALAAHMGFGAVDSNQQARQTFTPHRAAIAVPADGILEQIIEGIVNTDAVDRYNSRIMPDGMREPSGPVPLLAHHRTDQPVGVILELDQRDDAIALVARVTDDETWRLIREGALAGLSVGLIVHGFDDPADGTPVVITDWELVEVSVVSTPANVEATIHEARSITMPATASLSRSSELTVSPPRIVSEMPAAPRGLAQPAVHRRIAPSFHISSVITAMTNQEVLRGFEAEVCKELQSRSDVPTRGVRVPAKLFQQRQVSTNPGSAQALSPEQWLQELLDDVSAARRWGTLSQRLGFTVISSLRERVHIPRRMTRVNAGWIGKDAVAPESNTTFAEDQLGPLYAASWVPINRSALRYTDPAVDAIVTADLGQGLDDLIDRGVLFGTGAANQPAGLLTAPPAALTRDKNNTAIVADDLFWLKQAMMTQWRLDDATNGLRWVTNPAVVDRLRVTSKKETGAALQEWPASIVSWDTSSSTILDLMLLQSGRIEEVVGAPPGRYHMYLVNPTMGVVVYFGGASVDLIVDPYTLSTSGAVRITGFVDVNCVARDPNIVGALLNCQTIAPAVP